MGGERFNLFKGCPCAMTSTIVLRGGAEQFIAEVLPPPLTTQPTKENSARRNRTTYYPQQPHSLATTPWFTITGTHMFITSGTRTVMIQHHLHHVDGSTTTAPHCL